MFPPPGEHAKWRCDTPPQKGYLSDTGAIPCENKQNACDTALCDTISKGYFHARYDWTTGVPDNGNVWGKYRVVPRAYPSHPPICAYFHRVGNKERFRLPGAGGGALPLYSGPFARSYSVLSIARYGGVSRTGPLRMRPVLVLLGFPSFCGCPFWGSTKDRSKV